MDLKAIDHRVLLQSHHLMRTTFPLLLVFSLCLCLELQAQTAGPPAATSPGKLELAEVFGDHMVLQRQIKVPVWGWAQPGEAITVAMNPQTKTATADNKGKWRVDLDPMDTGAPRTMTVKGKTETVTLSDILLGDVWVCSGQSNMSWPVSAANDAAKEMQAANYPEIRLFEVGGVKSPKAVLDRLDPKDHSETTMGAARDMCTWRPCDPNSVKYFSATGYYFGRAIHQHLKVPIGLIQNSVGATPIEAWMSRESLSSNPELKTVSDWWAAADAFTETPEGKKQLKLLAEAADKKFPKYTWRPDNWRPPLNRLSHASTFFNSRVHPLIPYAIKGVIWYQGEGNASSGFEYRKSFPTLITDWRQRWGQGDFPFLFVQLANWGGAPPHQPKPSEWSEVRESQALALKLHNTGMAVAIDIGSPTEMHPKNKQDVGARLALAAEAVAYGEKIIHSGPMFRDFKVEGNKLRISFDSVGGGLVAKDGPLRSFAIAGEDQKFVWATADIQGASIVLSSDEVKQPVAARYGWYHNPGCNLYNAEGLPAPPFRTDSWPALTAGKGYPALAKKPVAFTIPTR